jgi:hypothetical protein
MLAHPIFYSIWISDARRKKFANKKNCVSVAYSRNEQLFCKYIGAGINLVIPDFRIVLTFQLLTFRSFQLSGRSSCPVSLPPFSGHSGHWQQQKIKKEKRTEKFTVCCLLYCQGKRILLLLYWSEREMRFVHENSTFKMKITFHRQGPIL